MLGLLDPDLDGIDPFDKTLPPVYKQKILRECMFNYWYFLREVVRIPSAGSPEGVPYIANRGNIAQTWCIVHGIDSWLCLPRRN